MRLLCAAAILSLGALAACSADKSNHAANAAANSTADSAKVILDRHVTAMKAGDLTAVMNDYADNALVIAPHGIVPGEAEVGGFDVFDGKANISKLFAVLTSKDNAAAVASMTTTYEARGNDVTLMRWVQFAGTPQEVSGTDVWVIRGGKVLSQAVLLNPSPAKK